MRVAAANQYPYRYSPGAPPPAPYSGNGGYPPPLVGLSPSPIQVNGTPPLDLSLS
jgi:hypothetical protein